MNAHVQVIEANTSSGENASWGDIPNTRQHVQEYSSHEPLFCEGDEANYVFEILEGVVCCYRVMCDGRRQVLSFSYPGELIGLVQGDNHRYGCDILSDARIRRIPRRMLLKAASDRPELGGKLLQYATSELALMQDHSVMLGCKSASEKVASFLLALAKKSGGEEAESLMIHLPMTRADIADYLGLTLETVSRQLTRLKIAGLIGLPQPQTIVVHDIFELENSAEASDDTY